MTDPIRARLDELSRVAYSGHHRQAYAALRAVLNRIDDFYAGKSTGSLAATMLADIAEHLGVTDAN